MIDARIMLPRRVGTILARDHYLGAAGPQGFAWQDEYGVMVWRNPRSRRLPQKRWLELVRWCLKGERNGGSRQFAAFKRWALANLPQITTFVSYSDPAQGHTGAVYKACNWIWAPTWHRLTPPPSGNGSWDGVKSEGVKDRWYFPLRPDSEREQILSVKL